jgi:phage repressor protein C with HTH and peptisase S24 domain
MKKTYSGDGQRLYYAVLNSELRTEDVYTAMGISRGTLYNYYEREHLSDEIKQNIAKVLGSTPDHIFNKITGDELRRRKAHEMEDEGLIFVPIYAQAGYSKHYLDPLYTSQLERMKIPNMPYKGDRYRVFEISDDSMEPTLKEHYYVICEAVDPDMWQHVADFYIYVIMTQDRLMVKRLYRKSEDLFVCISDNNKFYKQFLLPKSEIKELWIVKRKIDWELPPPSVIVIEL